MEKTSQYVTADSEQKDSSIDTLRKTIEELRTYEKKNLFINRLKLICSIVCLALCVTAVCIVFFSLQPTVQKLNDMSVTLTETGKNINTVANDLEKFDFDELSTSLQSIVETSKDTVDEVYKTAQGLSTLLEDADVAMEHINSIDFENLNNGIQKLNEILEPVADFFHIFH
ncbi:MAG: hypothetical protein II117_06870 [Clostridia bacterium]|nr:hypothetical protein [Clostridia bacterium]